MRTPATLAFSLILLSACAEATRPVAPEAGADDVIATKLVTGAAGPAEHIVGSFFAVAGCADDIGYNIVFGGPRTLVRHVAGNDTTLSFVAKEFQGWFPTSGLTPAQHAALAPDFTVLGGAEMFNIKREADGTLKVRIHNGTLVFESVDGTTRVLARHIIRVNPARGTTVDTWSCRVIGQG